MCDDKLVNAGPMNNVPYPSLLVQERQPVSTLCLQFLGEHHQLCFAEHVGGDRFPVKLIASQHLRGNRLAIGCGELQEVEIKANNALVTCPPHLSDNRNVCAITAQSREIHGLDLWQLVGRDQARVS